MQGGDYFARSLAVVFVILSSFIADTVLSEEEPASASATQPSCIAQAQGADAQQFTCSIRRSQVSHRYRFLAHFDGVHDDTMAKISLTIDGAPVQCQNGSKTQFREDEEGESYIDCVFSVDPAIADARSLLIKLKWSHAQYVRHELRAD